MPGRARMLDEGLVEALFWEARAQYRAGRVEKARVPAEEYLRRATRRTAAVARWRKLAEEILRG